METSHQLSDAEMFDINFGHILEDIGDNKEEIHRDTMELIRDAAVQKNIEFDGYFTERWKESADTIVNFDEDYFDDPDKRDLYVYLAAMVDDEIFGFVNQYHRAIEQSGFDRVDLTKEELQKRIDHLTKEKGVRF